ncbi:MAG: AbgT family transporter [Bacteroidales bacterium]|nr:AbgT family transporter [Bacteroidales bacterium]MDY0252973.1 AbgT family transporter [Tenuifilaceae bacterium]
MKRIFGKIREWSSKAFVRSLDYVEIIGNKLPHPATLFFLLAVIVALLSWLGHTLGVQATHPVDGSLIEAKNLLGGDGIRWMYTNLINNFLRFPPLGYVLVVMIGIGVAEGSGLFTTLIRSLVLSAPPRLVTGAIVLAGILSHLASEAGYVILIPLGAMIFHALGRHPMAGLAAAFAGVSGGFGANFFVGSIDPILAGISESAAQMIMPDITVNPAVNYYFMFISSFLVIIVGTWVTEKIVEPRLGKYDGTAEKLPIVQLTPKEKKGLRWAGVALLITLGLLAYTVIPENGIFRDPDTGSVLHSPFFNGIIIAILLMFFIPGLVYGIIVGTIKNDKEVAKYLGQSMSGMGSYIVLVFFAAQFVYFFNYSNLGIIFAIKGATMLQSIGLTGITLIVAFVVLSAFINMFMGSASAKWAIMAPVFIPMLMLIDPPYHPGLTQAAFRIGDSVTNLITPMMSYFALIVTYAQKYDEKYGVGTIISTMLPYTVMLTIGWILLLVLWMLLGIPLGPDGPLYIPM